MKDKKYKKITRWSIYIGIILLILFAIYIFIMNLDGNMGLSKNQNNITENKNPEEPHDSSPPTHSLPPMPPLPPMPKLILLEVI